MNGPDRSGPEGRDPSENRPGGVPRIPPPRPAPDDSGMLPPVRPGGTLPAPRAAADDPHPVLPPPSAAAPDTGRYEHKVLKALLGAWALSACSAEETAAVEQHLSDCAACADEAVRLREAVGLMHREDNLDLDPLLRSRVLESCLDRRPARIPVPDWAGPYDAETARLDALLRDMDNAEWSAPVRLRWFEGRSMVERESSVAGVLGHLMTVDGAVATALGLDDPLGPSAPPGGTPTARTEAYWQGTGGKPGDVHAPWRRQAHTLVRTLSYGRPDIAGLPVSYGAFALPLRDSLLDRAFECWVHAEDIAEAIAYPYQPPAAAHLNRMIDLAMRMLPEALARRRRAGLAGPARGPALAGAPGRSLHLEVEGNGGGDWYIALDSPAARSSEEGAVAHVALDGTEFCHLAAGHIPPEEAAAGQLGDREAIHDVLSAAASLSRL
ncbi:zf-HC2 domain-containing protein [Streptomyces meridianus]|uniref:Zf-HC2 domain-containing protein n=1 Tax=Streptomyces meridianus TaxID=2938945 RepID=A0ABT0X2P6_9ACTN|nr:zf-HC2 domain-containing protein [Streptomyces meridianus]MCM2576788.1 zf-HC2 domain-containing protein [Streptomyces meridianus]